MEAADCKNNPIGAPGAQDPLETFDLLSQERDGSIPMQVERPNRVRQGVVCCCVGIVLVLVVLVASWKNDVVQGNDAVKTAIHENKPKEPIKKMIWKASSLPAPELGENLVWYGPYVVPEPCLITRFLPLANLSFVHHLVVYKTKTSSSYVDTPQLLNDTSIPWELFHSEAMVFAWARTGQTTPLKFDATANTAFWAGPGTDAEAIYLNVHYEIPQDVLDSKFPINMALEATYKPLSSNHLAAWQRCEYGKTKCASSFVRQGLGIHILANNRLSLRPHQPDVVVKIFCRVNRNFTLFAYRNHGHLIATNYSLDVYRDGVYTGTVINRNTQDAQIFYQMGNDEKNFLEGDLLVTKCHYNTLNRDYTTHVGADLTKGEEMCNQYLMFYPNYNNGPRICEKLHHKPRSYKYKPIYFEGEQTLPEHESLGQVAGVAMSQNGRFVYVLARRSNDYRATEIIQSDTIFKLSASSGAMLNSFGSGMFVVPHGLAIDGYGKLWVTDTTLHQVFRLDPENGKIELTLGEARVPKWDTSHFDRPTDVAVDADTNRVFISDGYGNSRVAIFDYNGKYLKEWGRKGSPPGSPESFLVVHNVAFDHMRNRVYVADRENGRIKVYDASSDKLLYIWDSEFCRAATSTKDKPWLAHLSSVEFSSHLDVLFSIEGAHVVGRSPVTGQVVMEFSKGDGNQELVWPHDIAVSLSGAQPELFVAELDGKRVQQFTIAK
mmetsp:Transcript_18271/g.31099  ORF Transcript_18271/g.31099 Transcript_18271/m.31099 type:complete len:719 (+) Transcript_18271:27-2183(+)